MFLAYVFDAFTEAFYVWYCYAMSPSIGLWIVVCHILLPFLLLFDWTGALILFFILFKAHLRYLHVVRAFNGWSYSSSSSFLVEQTSLALWNNVQMTLYLADMAWWLSHCRCQLVWVGFLYTVVSKLPSACGMTRVSRKAKEPLVLMFSMVNCIPSSMELICVKNSSLWADFMTTMVSSTNLFHRFGGVWCCTEGFSVKFFHKYVGHYGT